MNHPNEQQAAAMALEAVERYDFDHGMDGSTYIAKDGDWVRYEDHAEALAAVMARAGELTDGEQLRECINSGQVSAAQAVAHVEAGELPLLPEALWPWNVGTPTYTAAQMRAYTIAALAAERAEVVRLREALTLAIRQNEHDMLMTGDELRICRAALTAPGENHE